MPILHLTDDSRYEGRVAVVSLTTGQLRSLVRICHVDAAFVAFEGSPDVVSVFGMSRTEAATTLASIRGEQSAAAASTVIAAVPVPLHHSDRIATLFVFGPIERAREASLAQAAAIVALEIAADLDMPDPSGNAQRDGGVSELIRQVAPGIDALNDAAAIVAWPRHGSQLLILYVNAAFEVLLGYDAANVTGRTMEFLGGPLTDLERIEFVSERLRTARATRVPIVYYRRDGVPMWVEMSLRGVAGAFANEPYAVVTLRDATTRKEFELALAKEKRKLQVTLAAIGDAVITTVADGRIDYVNTAARTMLGIDASEAYGEPIADLLRLSDVDGRRIDVLAGHDVTSGVVRGQAAFDLNATIRQVAYVSSRIAAEGYVVVLRDVTAQHRLSAKLSYEASHDPLTGIFNRRKFDELLDATIEAVRPDGVAHALAFLDLDRFKVINDNCGHAVGDRVLMGLANLLSAQLRGRDVLARIGGDEFALLLYDCSLDNARRVLEKLRASVEAYRISDNGVEYRVGVSIGIAGIDGSETDARVILARADAACYAAKSAGRNAIAG